MRVRKTAAALALSAGLVAGGIASGTGTAGAANPPCSGVGEPIPGYIGTWNGCIAATDGLWARWHGGSSDVTWSDPLDKAYRYNTRLYIYCWLKGPEVDGMWGKSSVWDAVGLYQEPGGPVTGPSDLRHLVFPDGWVWTGSNTPNVPRC
ncbi:hypothetical protein [Kitasatospora sp. NPDC008115]|uniref:hypothetical protein n=1 Tax=Kitasatospora sp. NPDC008115 TaxID=3364022 RepID=UPI0036EEBAEA